MKYFTLKNLKALIKVSLQIAMAFLLNLFFISNIFADINHSGNSSYEDSNQDWNGDGFLDGVDKNGGAVGDKLLTWSVAAGVHIVGSFNVEEDYNLTIEPSAIVKFHYGMNSNITVHGTLIADGDENNKIIFTSMADDSYGGDTNNDGDATVPSPGNWGSINFLDNSINCILDNTIIQYAAAAFWYGGTYTQITHAIFISNSNPIITSNTIQHILFHGFEAYGSEATITGNTISDIGWDGIFTKNCGASISANTIVDCGGNAISINSWPEYSITALPSFSGNIFSNNAINGVYIASGNIQQNLTLEAINNPYYVFALTIDSGYTLTIKPGGILKFGWGHYGPTGIIVNGTLITEGTMDNNVIFTSILDDVYGGDTNNDADSTVAEPGNWGSVIFNEGSGNSILNNTTIRFAGTENWGSYYSKYAIVCSNTSPTISNNTIQYGNYDGIYLHNSSPVINGNTISDFAWNGISLNNNSIPSIRDNNIVGCNGDAVLINSMPDYSIISFPSFSGNTFSNNNINAIHIKSGNIQQNLTIEAIDNPYAVDALTIDSGYTLTIKPGAILKFGWGYYGPTGIIVNGILNANGTLNNKIIFTSVLDDVYGGDTNNDADSTVAEAGNWGSIAFYEESENCILDNAIIRFAGTENWGSYYSKYAIVCSSASPTISNNTIQYGNYDGIYLANSSPEISGNAISDFAWSGISINDNSSPSIIYNTISNNSNGIYSSGLSNPLVNNNNILDNSDFGIRNADASIMINATDNWWGDISGPYDPIDGNPDYNPDGLGNEVTDYVDYRPWNAEQFVGVTEEEVVSGNSLSQNFPNPFNRTTKIEYSIPTFSYVTLKIYSFNNDEVISLIDEKKSPGKYSINFDASNLSSGIYFYRLQTGNIKQVKKMLLVK